MTEHLRKAGLTDEDKKALGELEAMLGKVADIKQRHQRPARRPASSPRGRSTKKA